MVGLSPKLPLTLDTTDGIALNKDFSETAKQNLKMVLLTNPGERIMNSGFGVGLLMFLFENNINQVSADLIDTINSQVQQYLPYISIEEMLITHGESDSYHTAQMLNLKIKYYVEPLDAVDTLEISEELT